MVAARSLPLAVPAASLPPGYPAYGPPPGAAHTSDGLAWPKGWSPCVWFAAQPWSMRRLTARSMSMRSTQLASSTEGHCGEGRRVVVPPEVLLMASCAIVMVPPEVLLMAALLPNGCCRYEGCCCCT